MAIDNESKSLFELFIYGLASTSKTVGRDKTSTSLLGTRTMSTGGSEGSLLWGVKYITSN